MSQKFEYIGQSQHAQIQGRDAYSNQTKIHCLHNVIEIGAMEIKELVDVLYRITGHFIVVFQKNSKNDHAN